VILRMSVFLFNFSWFSIFVEDVTSFSVVYCINLLQALQFSPLGRP